MPHQYNFTLHMEELRQIESKKKIVEDYEKNHNYLPNSFKRTTCYLNYIKRFNEFVRDQNFCKPSNLYRSFDWTLLFALYCSSINVKYKTEKTGDKTEIIINEKVGDIYINEKLSKLTNEDIVRLYKKRVEEHLKEQNAIEGKIGKYEDIKQARDVLYNERYPDKETASQQNSSSDTQFVQLINNRIEGSIQLKDVADKFDKFEVIEQGTEKCHEEKTNDEESVSRQSDSFELLPVDSNIKSQNPPKNHSTFDFNIFIGELRSNKEQRIVVEEYEKQNGQMPFSFEETECYKNYLSKFELLYKEANIRLPEDLEDDFDWPLLFCLIAGSFSSTYEIKRPNKIIIDNEEKNELLISISSGDTKITRTLDELWSFQVQQLFEIYILEQLQLSVLIHDPEEKQCLFEIREEKITLSQKIVNDSSYEEKIPYKEEMLYHYTSLESFEKILSSNTLWATNLENEYKCWIECFYQVYDALCLKDDCHTYLQLLDVIKRKVLDYFDKYKFYILCFCMKRDFREAWRRYTKKGGGICIGFNLKEINNDLYNNEHKIDLDLCNGKTEYNHSRVFNDVYEKIKEVLIDYKDSNLLYDDYISNADKFKILEECCLRSFLRLQDIKDISTIKDKEFRYYWFNPKQNPSKEVRYFAKGSSLVQYVELSTGEKKLPIKEIIIGPAYNKSKEIESIVKEKLTSCGFNVDSIKISHSEVNTTFL